MRIAVCGAHRVGKTTLAESLHEALPEYEYKAEAYYELEEEGFAFSEIPSRDDYVTMLEHSVKQIPEAGENVIFDRCPLDMLAYIHAVSNGSFEISSLYQKVQDVMNEIDLLVFVPIEKPDLIDCTDSDLPQLRKEVNDILSDLIWEFNSNTIEVTGSTTERCAQILNRMIK